MNACWVSCLISRVQKARVIKNQMPGESKTYKKWKACDGFGISEVALDNSNFCEDVGMGKRLCVESHMRELGVKKTTCRKLLAFLNKKKRVLKSGSHLTSLHLGYPTFLLFCWACGARRECLCYEWVHRLLHSEPQIGKAAVLFPFLVLNLNSDK